MNYISWILKNKRNERITSFLRETKFLSLARPHDKTVVQSYLKSNNAIIDGNEKEKEEEEYRPTTNGKLLCTLCATILFSFISFQSC